jgi:uncharacterized protein (DUF362 family)
MPERALVSLAGCTTYDTPELRSALQKVLAPFGGMPGLVSPGESILLKPNFVSVMATQRPSCTHSQVILGVAQMVREAGAHPIIADSPALGSSETVAKKTGLWEAACREGIPIRTLRRPVTRIIQLGEATFHQSVSADALEVDGIINLPKFKAHQQAGLTLGVKNLYGCVAGKRKACRHFASRGDLDWFSEMLVANAAILAPRFTLVDGVVGMEGQGPTLGTARQLGVLAGGKDLSALDATCCRLVGYPPLSLCTLKAARRLNFGTWDPAEIDLAGDPFETLQIPDFQFPEEISILFSLRQTARSIFRSWRKALAR